MGFFDRLKEGLKKTRDNFTDGMDQIFNSYEKITEEFYDELEETMIMGDIGVKTTEELLDHLREEVRAERIRQGIGGSFGGRGSLGNGRIGMERGESLGGGSGHCGRYGCIRRGRESFAVGGRAHAGSQQQRGKRGSCGTDQFHVFPLPCQK